MATAKKLTKDDAYKKFKDVINKCKFTEYYMDNNILICKRNDKSYLFILDDELVISIKDDNEFNLLPIPLTDDNLKLIDFSNFKDEEWIDIDSDKLYNGELIKIPVLLDDNTTIDVEINKGIFPYRLPKTEFKNISYRVSIKGGIPSLIIKKEYKIKLAGFNFTLMQAFQII